MAEKVRPVVRTRRNVRWLAAGVLSVCLGGLGAALLYANASSATPVITIKRTVYRDQVITADDLGISSLAAPIGVEAVPAERLKQIVGRTATIDLARGGLLSPDSYGDPVVPAGAVRLGLRLEPGRLPNTNLLPGTSVLLVPVAREDGSFPGGASVAATTASVPQLQPDGSSLFDVNVAHNAGERLARLASSGQLAVIRLPQGKQ